MTKYYFKYHNFKFLANFSKRERIRTQNLKYRSITFRSFFKRSTTFIDDMEWFVQRGFDTLFGPRKNLPRDLTRMKEKERPHHNYKAYLPLKGGVQWYLEASQTTQSDANKPKARLPMCHCIRFSIDLVAGTQNQQESNKSLVSLQFHNFYQKQQN